MKSRILVILLIGMLGFSLIACSSGDVMNAGGLSGDTEEDTDAEEIPVEIPETVKNLSDEENALLNGDLKDGVYTNQYFGYKFTAPEGWGLVRLNDDVNETTDFIPLAQAYEDGWGGLYYQAASDSTAAHAAIEILALKEEEIGLTEEELIRKYIDSMKEIGSLIGEDEEDREFAAVSLAGEEHPAVMEETHIDGETQLNVTFRIPKGDFEYYIHIFIPNGSYELDDITGRFEKL